MTTRNPYSESNEALIRQMQAERQWRAARLEVAQRGLANARGVRERLPAEAFVERRRRELEDHDAALAMAQAELIGPSDTVTVRLVRDVMWSHAAARKGDVVALPRAEAERLFATSAAVPSVEVSPIAVATP